MERPKDNVTFEDARLIWRDFTGERNRFNSDRTFSIVLTPDVADELEKDGWNVKRRPPREEGDDPLCTLAVKVVFGKVPPKIVLINSGGKSQKLDKDTVGILDWIKVKTADVVIRPYNYDFNGHTGTKAYLKTLYVTKEVDALEEKYAEYEELPFEDD